MATPLILALAVVGILLLGAVLTFAWICGMAGGTVMQVLMPPAAPLPAAADAQGIDSLIRRTRAAAGLPPIN